MASFSLDSLLNLEETKLSRDLSGYITYLYGSAKVGKTTLARDMGALIVACEDGTHALAGAYAQKIMNWSDMRALARFLKDDRMKAKYKAIALDTVDVAASLCEKYICSQNDVEALGKIPYGGGWAAFKKEFEEVFRGITMEGYAVLFISHDKTETVTRPNGTEYSKIVPTVSTSINNIVKNMADIIAYGYFDPETQERYMMLRSLDGMVEAGCRFQYIEPRIKFGYNELVKALNDAIDREAEVNAGMVVDKKEKVTTRTLDFDELMKEFQSIICNIPGSSDPGQATEEGKHFASYWAPRISEITTKYLGSGKKVSQCSRNQVEQLELIVDELKELIKG